MAKLRTQCVFNPKREDTVTVLPVWPQLFQDDKNEFSAQLFTHTS